jgi:hypothetical protein
VAITSKLWALLTRDQRVAAAVFLGLMIIGMILEMLGIGLVVPAIVLMSRTSVPTAHPEITRFLVKLGNPTREHLVMFGMLALVAVYAIKSLFSWLS